MLRKATTTSKSTTKAPARAAAKPPVKTPAKAAAKAPAKDAVQAADTPAKAPAKTVPKEVPTAKAKEPVKTPPATKARSKAGQAAFLVSQRQLLIEERANYLRSADALKAQADSLALEHEPGDVQFDEEGGEGGTSNVDRELDLVLSAQARAAAVEIDRALSKIEIGTYGLCEQCGQPIPDARLQALPQAALCVACKSGGLSSRR
jgi:DnaK suppressor protein